MNWIEDNLGWVIGFFVALMVGALGFGVYLEVTAEKIYLVKADWVCTKSTTTYIPITQKVGTTNVTTMHQQETCHSYVRR